MTPEQLAEIEAEFRSSTLPPYGMPRNVRYVANARKNFPLLLAEVKRLAAELRLSEIDRDRADSLSEMATRGLESVAAKNDALAAENAELRRQYAELVDALCSPSWMGRNRHSSVLGLAKRLRDSQQKLRPLGLNDDAHPCVRAIAHEGPCNGFPRNDCHGHDAAMQSAAPGAGGAEVK